MYPDVGFARGDGSLSSLGTITGQTRNVVGVIGTLGKITPSTADTAGDSLIIHGGAGTGNAGGGAIHFRTQPAGGPSGNTVPDAVDALDIGNTQRVTVYKAARITPTTYANRIASAVDGDMMYFTDSTTSTYGATIAGGGANHVLGLYNGTNWIVH